MSPTNRHYSIVNSQFPHKWPFLAIIFYLLVWSPLVTLGDSGSAACVVAEPWPAADRMFRKDHRWLGGDGGGSVDLGDGRVLWLFGDSFIATTDHRVRKESVLIRNSIAIQSGYDPVSATIRFYWQAKDNVPQSFFPDEKPAWVWPGHGIVTNGFLLVFLLEIHSADNALGFEFGGWKASRVFNYKDSPGKWKLSWADVPANPHRIITGSGGVLIADDYLYTFGSGESGRHDVYLARWPLRAVAKGDLKNPQWWVGQPGGWCEQERLTEKPAPLFTNGQSEFTVHVEPRLRGFVQVQTTGFGSADIGFRTAEFLVGPWSSLKVLYRPKEYGAKGVLVYAGKAHPEQLGWDMILTYVVNHLEFHRVVEDTSLYYPRFLRCRITTDGLNIDD